MKTNLKRLSLLMLFPLLFLVLFSPSPNSVRAQWGATGAVGNAVGVKVHEYCIVHQNQQKPYATDLHFKLWQKEDNIHVNGAEVKTSAAFTDLTLTGGKEQPEPYHSSIDNVPECDPENTEDDLTHAVDVVASGGNIPYCEYVWVDATFWLTSWNAKVMSDFVWTQEGQEPKEGKPDEGWVIGFPIQDPMNETQYLHSFTIANYDTTSYLNVTGLAFNATMDLYENLTQVDFTSAYPDFTLAPGESWSVNITTIDSLIWGHIYLKYGLTGSGVYFVETADHPIIKYLSGDINVDGTVDSSDLGWMGMVWGAFRGYDPNYFPGADLSHDGVIDSTDLGIMGAHWGEFDP